MARTLLPPRIGPTEFQQVAGADEDQLEQVFRPFVRDLHGFLNGLDCLKDIQEVRRRYRTARAERPFGTFATQWAHWYTFNHGGRNECQFNVGLSPDYLRIGLGFEKTLKKGGSPEAVHDAYIRFATYLSAHREEAEEKAAAFQLEVEWVPAASETLAHVATPEVVEFLLEPRGDFLWAFRWTPASSRYGRDDITKPSPVGPDA